MPTQSIQKCPHQSAAWRSTIVKRAEARKLLIGNAGMSCIVRLQRRVACYAGDADAPLHSASFVCRVDCTIHVSKHKVDGHGEDISSNFFTESRKHFGRRATFTTDAKGNKTIDQMDNAFS